MPISVSPTSMVLRRRCTKREKNKLNKKSSCVFKLSSGSLEDCLLTLADSSGTLEHGIHSVCERGRPPSILMVATADTYGVLLCEKPSAIVFTQVMPLASTLVLRGAHPEQLGLTGQGPAPRSIWDAGQHSLQGSSHFLS